MHGLVADPVTGNLVSTQAILNQTPATGTTAISAVTRHLEQKTTAETAQEQKSKNLR